jgi:DNA-binding MarR family transcriptional regulator
MKTPFEEIAGLDRLVHEPTRLALLTALAACKAADFLFLQRLVGLTKGNLSAHLAKLEEAGLIEIEKRLVGKRPNTLVRLTQEGAEAVAAHWQRIERLRDSAASWSGAEGLVPATAE